jgi:hypothetical protein
MVLIILFGVLSVVLFLCISEFVINDLPVDRTMPKSSSSGQGTHRPRRYMGSHSSR